MKYFFLILPLVSSVLLAVPADHTAALASGTSEADSIVRELVDSLVDEVAEGSAQSGVSSVSSRDTDNRVHASEVSSSNDGPVDSSAVDASFQTESSLPNNSLDSDTLDAPHQRESSRAHDSGAEAFKTNVAQSAAQVRDALVARLLKARDWVAKNVERAPGGNQVNRGTRYATITFPKEHPIWTAAGALTLFTIAYIYFEPVNRMVRRSVRFGTFGLLNNVIAERR